MKKLFKYADVYAQKCSWKDFALLKICLCALGIMIGLSIPKDKKKMSLIAASTVFTASYIPLMTKFLKIIVQEIQKTRV
ncbi:MAG: permease of phosphate ABC transporter [Lachnospiraceae bacterium]|nr:permease of phosphate ABC transporter [Lachnospiraceae bacterium]